MQVSFNKIQNYNNPQQNSFPAFKMNMKELPAVDRFVAKFIDSQIQSLGNLQSIGRNVYIEMSPLRKKDFESIKVGGIFIGS